MVPHLHESPPEYKYLSIYMIRKNMQNLPNFALPTYYMMTAFKRDSGHEEIWAKIVNSTGEFKTIQIALDYFNNEFGAYHDDLERGLFFLTNSNGQFIGTAMAWTDKIDGEVQGRLKWVSIIPEYWGKGLAKPMLSFVLNVLAEFHIKCFLGSQTTSWKAVKMYRDFGFVPFHYSKDCDEAWLILDKLCNTPRDL
jgi:GNAT superfamily N-acetyltransferase